MTRISGSRGGAAVLRYRQGNEAAGRSAPRGADGQGLQAAQCRHDAPRRGRSAQSSAARRLAAPRAGNHPATESRTTPRRMAIGDARSEGVTQ